MPESHGWRDYLHSPEFIFFLWLAVNKLHKIVLFQIPVKGRNQDKIDITVAGTTETLLKRLILSTTDILRESFH